MSDVIGLPLADIGRIVTGSTPPASHPEYFGDAIPFITPSDFDGSRRVLAPQRYLSEAGVLAFRSRIVENGVGVSCIGSQMGQTVLLDGRAVTNQQINTLVVDESIASRLYVYYALSARRQELFNLGAGASTVPLLNKSDFSKVRLPLPPLDEQRRIAHILGTLDDKIELNRRMSHTLEEMARALFKSWFVDFDPVRAKAAGRDTGLPKHLANLFPDRLVDSDLGEIPEGWTTGVVGDMARVLGGSTPSTKVDEFWAGGTVPFATPKDFSRLTSPVLQSTERCITNAGLTQISSGALPVGTVLMSSRAPIGYLAITDIHVAINQGFIAMIPAPEVSNIFLLLWAQQAQPEIIARANGSTFLEISKSSFREIAIVKCPADVMAEFDLRVRPLFERIVAGLCEQSALVEIRERLLTELLTADNGAEA